MASNAVNLTVAPLEAKFGIFAKELAVCAEHGEYAAILSKHREGPSGCRALTPCSANKTKSASLRSG